VVSFDHPIRSREDGIWNSQSQGSGSFNFSAANRLLITEVEAAQQTKQRFVRIGFISLWKPQGFCGMFEQRRVRTLAGDHETHEKLVLGHCHHLTGDHGKMRPGAGQAV
jgi:hypothetical protein